MLNKQKLFMQEALKEAKKAFADYEVPIGAVVVHDDRIISRGIIRSKLKEPDGACRNANHNFRDRFPRYKMVERLFLVCYN